MRRSVLSRIRVVTVASCALVSSIPALAAPPADLDARVEAVLAAAQAPGVAIAIVENGKITLAKGYGVRELGKPDRVDGETLFLTASVGKAFTVADLAILVDQGKLQWDDPVIKYLPWFQMYDPWVTREITVRDLLVHHSGLGHGEGDLLWMSGSTRTRKETVAAVRYLKPAYSFRSHFAYDNILYMVAGQLIEEVTGQSWERFTAEHLLKPAGMTRSTSDDSRRLAATNHAQPHARVRGGVHGSGEQQVFPEGLKQPLTILPAGGLGVSANDMARWLSIQLAHGELPEGGRLFSDAQSKQMWTPVIPIDIPDYPPELKATQPHFSAYALGWFVSDYKGTRLVWHMGATAGYAALVVLVPEKNVGFCVLLNSEEASVVYGLMYELLDHYLAACQTCAVTEQAAKAAPLAAGNAAHVRKSAAGDFSNGSGEPKANWPQTYAAFFRERTDVMLAASKKRETARVKVGPSLPLAKYAGDYVDPWYGPMSIELENGKLLMDFKQTTDMVGPLEHFQYDTFRTHWRGPDIEPAYVTFALDAQGKVDHITVSSQIGEEGSSFDYQDLLFTPVAAKP